MPRIFEWKGYRFFFFSDEGSPLEPCHVHVSKGNEYAKIWLEPEVSLGKAYGINSTTLKALLNKVEESEKLIKEKWNEYFSN